MTELTDLSETDASNITITLIDIDENCAPSGINNAIRNTLGLIRRAFKSTIFRLRDSTDQTKLLAFDLSGLTTATTRTVTLPDKSGTALFTNDNASQAEQEAATSAVKFVTPAVQHFHPSAAKAWVLINYDGGVPGQAVGYNVSSITDSGTGVATVNFSTAFTDVNYAAVASLSGLGVANNIDIETRNAGGVGTLSASACPVRCLSSAGASIDPAQISFNAFGDI